MKKFILFIFCILIVSNSLSAEIERRAAIDVGSGGTKVTIADVDVDSGKIAEVILDTSYPVPYQASLDKSQDGTFDETTRKLGLKTFKEIKELAESHGVKKISAIATSAFRKSNNSRDFIDEIQNETKIKVRVIPQMEEGEVAFSSALANGEFNRQDVVVLDIGTGSLQMTTTNENDGLSVYMGEQMGSVAFKFYIIDTIQEKEAADTPNPLTEEHVKEADRYARAFARRAYPVIKEKIKTQGPTLGIGRLFYHSIRPLAAEDGIITRDGLRAFINSTLNKTDEELGDPFANVNTSNCILVLALMKALHIQEILPVETTTTRGMLVHPSYWEQE